MPIMTSESTRFLGQPREMNPTLGGVRDGTDASSAGASICWSAMGGFKVEISGGIRSFYFSCSEGLSRASPLMAGVVGYTRRPRGVTYERLAAGMDLHRTGGAVQLAVV